MTGTTRPAAPASTIGGHVRDARQRLERAGIEPDEAAIDADLLARHVLGGWERGQLLAGLRDAAPPGFADGYAAAVDRRAGREPAAYITGIREFWNLDFAVTRDTLIPRPETELIVEEALARLCDRTAAAGARPAVIADVGTGSGNLAVSIARWLPDSRVVATDLSSGALAVARRNAARHQVDQRVAFVRADLLAGLDGPFDVIVSNPPYVPAGHLPGLQPEVGRYEPARALDGGADGLDVVRRLVPAAAARLAPGGWFLFEFGFGQAEAVGAIVAAGPGLALDIIRDDYAGIPRVAVARRL